jgi:hypothetical protein
MAGLDRYVWPVSSGIRTPQLSVVHGDFETLLRKLLRRMTRETTPELTQMLERLRYRAPPRGVRNDEPPADASHPALER